MSRRVPPASPYQTDPPSASSTRRPVFERPMLDADRYMVALRQGLISGLSPLDHPSDDLLIATVVSLGCPRVTAEEIKHHLYPHPLRLAYYGLWIMVAEAAKGDPEAKETVDVARAYWAEARRHELISDTADHTVGLWER